MEFQSAAGAARKCRLRGGLHWIQRNAPDRRRKRRRPEPVAGGTSKVGNAAAEPGSESLLWHHHESGFDAEPVRSTAGSAVASLSAVYGRQRFPQAEWVFHLSRPHP